MLGAIWGFSTGIWSWIAVDMVLKHLRRSKTVDRDATVFGWKSPWSGDDVDPIPWTYRVWVRLYWSTRKAKHWVGWHDWRERLVAQPTEHCDWCGKGRTC